MSSPWLSILIPVYNVRDYLGACLDSVVSQCKSNIEIIVLDDQSTDDSFDLLCSYVSSSGYPIRILQHPRNGGLSAARNTLAAEATGEYLWFLDSDDVLADHAISQLYEITERHNPDLIICDFEIWRPGLDSKLQKKKELHVSSFFGRANCLSNNPVMLFQGIYATGKLHAWSKIAKRHLWLNGVRFPEGRYFEDMYTTPRLALMASNFYYSNKVWLRYRQRDGSILAQFNIKKIDDMMAGLDDVLSLWLAKYPQMDIKSRYLFVRYCIKIYFYALKELKRLGVTDKSTLMSYRLRLFHSMHGGRMGLIKHYLGNGDFFRLVKALHRLS